ncbi:ribonuclease Z [Candidatus Woesearchaeota archaeon]|nr:ribonuclease Z [Candidatus Woesearchaeota archaeon]
MEAVFLGTGSSVPTKERNHAGIFVSYRNEGFLLDCGEGVQRQLKVAGISLTKITRVFITHWHGDHSLGLPGLFQSLGSSDFSGRIQVYGPRGTRKRFMMLRKVFASDNNVDMEVIDVRKRVFLECDDFFFEALPLEHSTPCLGFRFVERDRRRINMDAARKLGLAEGPLIGRLQEGKSVKLNGRAVRPDELSYVQRGRKFAYITDTGLCNNAVELARDADLLVCEATYDNSLEDKAAKYRHLTAGQAALLASKASVKRLVLTHFSQRYRTASQIEEDARNVFPDVVCAYDFMKVKI